MRQAADARGFASHLTNARGVSIHKRSYRCARGLGAYGWVDSPRRPAIVRFFGSVGRLVITVVGLLLFASPASAQPCAGETPFDSGNRIKVGGTAALLAGATGGFSGSGTAAIGNHFMFGKFELGGTHYSNTGSSTDSSTGPQTFGYSATWLTALGGLQFSIAKTGSFELCPLVWYYREAAGNLGVVPFPAVSNGPVVALGVGFAALRLRSLVVRPFLQAGWQSIHTTIDSSNALTGPSLLRFSQKSGFLAPGIGFAVSDHVSIVGLVRIPLIDQRVITSQVAVSMGFGTR